MNTNTTRAALAGYLIVAIVTFGYSFNHDYEYNGFPDMNGTRATICAMLWPLYLSKVAFEGVRK